MKRARVLLIEDNPDDAQIVQDNCSMTDYFDVTHTARNAQEAIDYLEGRGVYADRHTYRTPELILLDLCSSPASGLQIVQWLRANAAYKRFPIVALARSRELPDVNAAYGAGVNSYIVKPDATEERAEALRTISHFWTHCATTPGSVR